MRVQTKVRSSFIVGVAFMATAAGLSCYDSPKFQPITSGAKPWTPPNDPNNPWDPEPPCVTGYYVAIDNCPGCTGVSYALCTGVTFTQCVCGGPFWPGVECPKSLVCCPNDFPPYNWLELQKYSGPGWAGLNPGFNASTAAGCSGHAADAGVDAGADASVDRSVDVSVSMDAQVDLTPHAEGDVGTADVEGDLGADVDAGD
jgi:hypothetical protein